MIAILHASPCMQFALPSKYGWRNPNPEEKDQAFNLFWKKFYRWFKFFSKYFGTTDNAVSPRTLPYVHSHHCPSLQSDCSYAGIIPAYGEELCIMSDCNMAVSLSAQVASLSWRHPSEFVQKMLLRCNVASKCITEFPPFQPVKGR